MRFSTSKRTSAWQEKAKEYHRDQSLQKMNLFKRRSKIPKPRRNIPKRREGRNTF
jgi:hypothetical protein